MATVKRTSLFLLFCGLLYLSACENDTIVPTKLPVIPPGSVKFSTDIAPVLNDQCSSCHNQSFNPDLLKADSYNSLKNGGFVNKPSSTSKLMEQIRSGHNTSVFLSQDFIAKLASWIDDGAPNN